VRLQQPKRSAAICILPSPAAKPHGEIRSKSDVLQLIGIADHVDCNDTANTVIQSHGIDGTVASAQYEAGKQQCMHLLYSGGMALGREDVCGFPRNESVKIRKECNEKCVGMFAPQQEQKVLGQALKDARSDYAKRGRSSFCAL